MISCGNITFTDASSNIAGWSSPVARWAHNPKVRGSNPLPATIKKLVTAMVMSFLLFW